MQMNKNVILCKIVLFLIAILLHEINIIVPEFTFHTQFKKKTL